MRKEIVVAIVAGVLVGLIIAFGVWRANRAIDLNPGNENTPQDTQVISDFGLTLVSPSNRQIVSEDAVVVSGATSANSTVVILTVQDEYLAQADAEGAFEIEVELVAGLNQLAVYAFDQNLQTATEHINVVYSTQFSVNEDEDTQEATDSADALRQRVQEKLEKVASSPVFYVGAITDKQESTLQISNFALPGEETGTGSISQIAVEEDAEIVGANGSEQTFEDVAIGDFIIAMGFVANGDEVLSAKRILITSIPEQLEKLAFVGNISEIQSKKATVSGLEENLEIAFGSRWVGPEISELEEGEQVVVITEADDADNLVLLIEKLSEL